MNRLPNKIGFAPWTLRRRLVVGVTAVVAVVLASVGMIVFVALRSSLVAVVDTQLDGSMSAFVHSVNKFRDGQQANGQAKPLTEYVGQAPGTIIACIEDGVVTDSANFSDADVEPLSASVVDDIESRTWVSGAQSIDIDGLGEYRVQAQTDTGSRTLITGVSLDPVDDAVFKETVTIAVLALIALAATVGGVVAVVRFALRPLARVARTAAEVAALPLGRGDVAITARVAEPDVDPRTEVGRVGDTLNKLLSHVDDALSVRAETDKRMRQFITDASHELRTPLAAIQGYAELTRQDSSRLPATTEYSLARIEAEAKRMSSLVADLLLLARLDENEKVETTEIDFADVVFNAVNDARASAPTHHWSVDVPTHSVMVRGDTERLHQLTANLLSNARVHTPPGTDVATTLRTTPAGAAELTIVDNGPGIDPSIMPELFERFVRADKGRSRHNGSAGLGLAIVTSILDALGGTVDVESDPGRTAFTVVLPLDAHQGTTPDRISMQQTTTG